MDIIFEFVFELIAELTSSASTNPKVPKPVRFILTAVIILFCTAVIALIIIAGALILKKSVIAGLILIAVGIFLLIKGIGTFRRTYLKR